MLKRDSVNAEQKCRQMQDSVTDAAEGFSELTTIPLNTIYVNLERTQAGDSLLGETQDQRKLKTGSSQGLTIKPAICFE